MPDTAIKVDKATKRFGQRVVLDQIELDVFKGEPAIDPRYRSLENVFLLPHIGSATPGTRSAMAHKCIDNLEQFFRGERPTDLLT